jgi:hypothetical protein
LFHVERLKGQEDSQSVLRLVGDGRRISIPLFHVEHKRETLPSHLADFGGSSLFHVEQLKGQEDSQSVLRPVGDGQWDPHPLFHVERFTWNSWKERTGNRPPYPDRHLYVPRGTNLPWRSSDYPQGVIWELRERSQSIASPRFASHSVPRGTLCPRGDGFVGLSRRGMFHVERSAMD